MSPLRLAPQREAPEPPVEWRISEAPDDDAWDAFVNTAPGGHHNQSALWGQVKATVGWAAFRLVALQDGQIVAGAQLLLRPLPLGGAVGFVPKGPLLEKYDPALARQLLTRLHALARQKRVRFLLLQPPGDGHEVTAELSRHGFRPSHIRFLPVATTVVDLRPEPEAILARMKSKTRYNIRLASRKGITVRSGTAQDLPTFHRLLMATARRQGFREYELPYFERLFTLFEPGGHVRLLLAEYQGQPLSALLLIAYGRTAIYKKGGWSGAESKRHPNELLQWHAIEWARAQGYTAYDLEGIDETNARQLLADAGPTRAEMDSLTRFKLGFGGDIVLNPGPCDVIYNPALRPIYRHVYARLRTHSLFKTFTHRLLGRATR